ncbi:F/Y-rich N-terminus family protein [Histomonas meleagridis]|uniref:F/Y-rich N-terminus family protein n=1 Tax=Histomonas meleagridis TaxID=135588 RepID=UPI003559B839|nr:F/Y-rich N-terminus family protein [Histomonas meleagridis]KAH0800744.1 F/Y-rich N-terminus family protein [Histomonas meleagridis]
MLRFYNSSSLDNQAGKGSESGIDDSCPRIINFVYHPKDQPYNSQISSSPSIENYNSKHSNDDDEFEYAEMSSSDTDTYDEVQVETSEKSPFEKIIAYRVDEDQSYSYLVKKRNRPYRECEWVSTDVYLQYPNAAQSLKRYHKRVLAPPSEPYYNPEYNNIEKVIAVRGHDPPEYFVKWCGLEYDNCTWEVDVDQESINVFYARNAIKPRPHFRRPSPESYQKIEENPEFKHGLKLFEYQLEGLNWLLFCWYNRKNCILADEMGLGKTVQAIAFLNRLYTQEHLPGPFLIIAPLTTLPHWLRTFNEWTDLNAVVYSGSRQSREIIRQYELFHDDGVTPKFDALIVQYDYIMSDTSVFSQFSYNVLIVDEAHRLKNAHSKLLQSLTHIHSEFRLLLTGTPLQNTIEELQTLLEFLHPGNFTDVTSAETMNDVKRLRKILKPHLLRRLKADVDKNIAAKEETIIECTLTKTQKQFYKAVLENNAGFLSKGANLKNISMDLRKVCLHPYLIKGAEEKILAERGTNLTDQEIMDCLIRSSGKFILLDKLLPKLKSDGHRVLIFSQMTKLLDLLEYYLDYFRYKHLRIDGNVPGRARQPLIDQFNAKDSDIFIFLLCTRAGGLGINLNSADTVIIFDSDWNPQNDLQAQARCHRIGQTKVVKVYRLLTKNTYEEHMFQAASLKLGLGHAILDKEKNKEIDQLLRKGAYHMLNDVEEENFNEQDIDQILSRSKVMVYNEAAGSSFSKANFDIEDEENSVDLEDPNFWSKILPQQPENKEEEVSDDGYMRTRRRVQSQYFEDDIGDEDSSKEWRRTEREKLQHLLSWYGWDRWEEAQKLCGLKRPVLQVKLAARAFLRWLLYNHNDVTQYTTARMLLEKANTKEFDSSFVNLEDAEATDAEFMKQPAMIDPDFVQLMQRKGGAWIKRIELLYYVTMGVEKANRQFDQIIVPKCQGNLPAEWWTLNDDRCLIYGTWKYGFARYDEFHTDPEIPFTYKSMEIYQNIEHAPQMNLTPRIKKLAAGIKKYYSTEQHSSDDIPTDVYRPKVNLWRKKDKSTVLQQMLHAGVPLKENGDYDWAKFTEICGFFDKTEEQVEKFVYDMMDTGENDNNNNNNEKQNNGNDETNNENNTEKKINNKSNSKKKKKDKDDDKESTGPAITAGRIKQRFQSLTRLRRTFMEYSEEALKEYFQYLPRWRNVPRGWTNQMEYEFFKEISKRGWGVCGDILKSSIFDGVFDGSPPTFVTLDTRVMRRLDQVLNYIHDNTLEQLREREAVKPKSKSQNTGTPELTPVPDIAYNEDGTPVMPINLTSTSYISCLGKIVTDRSAFHTERYIYPAGFKSSRLYASTLDPTKKVRYTCEILDVGEPVPLFRVTMDEHPEIYYEGNSPTSPWNLILKRILELRTENNPRALSISGPEYYGLASPVAIYLIQQMPDAKKCVNYVERKFAPPTQRNVQTTKHTKVEPKKVPKVEETNSNSNSNGANLQQQKSQQQLQILQSAQLFQQRTVQMLQLQQIAASQFQTQNPLQTLYQNVGIQEQGQQQQQQQQSKDSFLKMPSNLFQDFNGGN